MHVRVEVAGEEVTVRASRNGFSEQRKSAFIRELSAEGRAHRDLRAHARKPRVATTVCETRARAAKLKR